MSDYLLFCRYDGEWKKKDGQLGAYEWVPNNYYQLINTIIEDERDDLRNITRSDLHAFIFERAPFERRDYEVKLSYIPLSCQGLNPKYIIINDFDVRCYLLDQCRLSKSRSILHVELIKNKNNSEDVNLSHSTDDTGCCSDDVDTFMGVNVNLESSMASAPTPVKQTPPLPKVDENLESAEILESARIGEKLKSTPATPSSTFIPSFLIDDSTPILRSTNAPFCDGIDATFSFNDGIDLHIGHEFSSKEEIMDLVLEASVMQTFHFIRSKSSKSLISFKCRSKDCKWNLRAAKTGRVNVFSLRVHNNIHTCSPSIENRGEKTSASMVCKMLKDYPSQYDTPAPKTISKMMTAKGLVVSYSKALRGKHKARSAIRGDPEESYAILPSYLYMLKSVNPGTVADYCKDVDDKFVCLFFALGACIEGFQVMRKVIVIDNTHLKTKDKGVLLVCTAQDGNKHQYPLAFGVVKNESDVTWIWFLEKLKDLIPDSEILAIISDRNASIKNVVGLVYPLASHGYCTYHISQNIRTRIRTGRGIAQRNEARDGVVSKFIGCAEAYTLRQFEKCFHDLNLRQPESNVTFHEYMKELLLIKERWARSYFKCARYNILTSNGVESINASLVSARSFPLILMLDEIVNLICSWFNKHRNESCEGALSQLLTLEVETTLHARKQESTFYDVKELNKFTGEFEVTRAGSLDPESFLVDLQKKSCSCRVFDIDRIPCENALAAFSGDDMDLVDLCSEFYKKELWALAYCRTIYPVPSQSSWRIPNEVMEARLLPPDYRKGLECLSMLEWRLVEGGFGRNQREQEIQESSNLQFF